MRYGAYIGRFTPMKNTFRFGFGKKLVLHALAMIGTCSPIFATPSGLNNIPTADTIGEREVAVQAFDSFGGTEAHDFSMGFKTGLDLSSVHLELGLDGHLVPNSSGPFYFQTKAGFEPWKGGKIAVGVANVAVSDQSRAGDPFTYSVLTQDLQFFRVSAGYGIQTRNNSVLLGLDRTWKVVGHDLNLNADIVQTNDQSRWLSSVGLKYELCKSIVLEGWANLPDHGKTSFVAKLNYVFRF